MKKRDCFATTLCLGLSLTLVLPGPAYALRKQTANQGAGLEELSGALQTPTAPEPIFRDLSATEVITLLTDDSIPFSHVKFGQQISPVKELRENPARVESNLKKLDPSLQGPFIGQINQSKEVLEIALQSGLEEWNGWRAFALPKLGGSLGTPAILANGDILIPQVVAGQLLKLSQVGISWEIQTIARGLDFFGPITIDSNNRWAAVEEETATSFIPLEKGLVPQRRTHVAFAIPTSDGRFLVERRVGTEIGDDFFKQRGYSYSVEVIDLQNQTEQPLFSYDDEFDNKLPLPVAYSPRTNQLAFPEYPHSIALIQVAQPEDKRAIDLSPLAYPGNLTFSSNGQLVAGFAAPASSPENRVLFLVDAANGILLGEVELGEGAIVKQPVALSEEDFLVFIGNKERWAPSPYFNLYRVNRQTIQLSPQQFWMKALEMEGFSNPFFATVLNPREMLLMEYLHSQLPGQIDSRPVVTFVRLANPADSIRPQQEVWRPNLSGRLIGFSASSSGERQQVVILQEGAGLLLLERPAQRVGLEEAPASTGLETAPPAVAVAPVISPLPELSSLLANAEVQAGLEELAAGSSLRNVTQDFPSLVRWAGERGFQADSIWLFPILEEIVPTSLEGRVLNLFVEEEWRDAIEQKFASARTAGLVRFVDSVEAAPQVIIAGRNYRPQAFSRPFVLQVDEETVELVTPSLLFGLQRHPELFSPGRMLYVGALVEGDVKALLLFEFV